MCSPGYFKVRPGTGITSGQQFAYCPYCRHKDAPDKFTTKRQIQYAKDVMMREAHVGVGRMISNALGLGPSGRRKFGGDLLSVEMSLKQGSPPTVFRPFEEELERAVVCPHCGLDHAVYGLAVWCSDCGRDIFMTHVKAETDVVVTMLSDVERRRETLGPRVAARDIENCLEDTVSIFEAVLRALLVRRLKDDGKGSDEVDGVLKKIGNRFQNPDMAREIVEKELGLELFAGVPDGEIQGFGRTFEKRHPITHNLGVVDRKYIERAMSAESEGKQVRVSAQEVSDALKVAAKLLEGLHARLFPPQE